jgi:elongation factor Ts
MANEISLAMIQQLRDRTGAGMMDCKKALIEADGDMERAIELLRKKGAAVAAKRSGNTTAEGLVYAYIHPGSRIGVMVEVNCETDFVARTEDMKKFAADICMHIAAMKPLYLSPEEVDAQYLDKERRLFKEQLEASGKPEKIIEQIVEGKIQKLYSEVCLMKQTFVKNDKLTIDDVLKELIGKVGENIKIRRFARFEIGA